jgi:hypothetical protein
MEDRLPTVNEMKKRPKNIQTMAISISNYVNGVMSPYPTDERVVTDQYKESMYRYPIS